MSEELKLVEYGGQCCDAVIVKRDDQSVFVQFRRDRGYGGPNMEIDKVRELLGRMEVVAGVSSTVRRDSITVDLLAACKAIDSAIVGCRVGEIGPNEMLAAIGRAGIEAAIAKAEGKELIFTQGE